MPESPAVLLAHLTGNPNSRQAALALAEAGWLVECHTTLAPPRTRLPIGRLMPRAWRRLMARRAFPAPVSPRLRTHPWWELGRLVARQGALPRWVATRLSVEQVARRFDRAVARRIEAIAGINVVYGYMDSSLESFRAARARGMVTVYELPTPHWRTVRDLVATEAERRPEWAATLPAFHPSDEVMRRRDEELALADRVIVPSRFVRESLAQAPGFTGEVVVVPYGCPAAENEGGNEDENEDEDEDENGLLRVLFVGTLSQSKGLADLIAAMDQLRGEASLTIIGGQVAPVDCPALAEALRTHRYPGVLSHEAVLAEMRRHDVLVLPTLYEGLALVLLEALSCGLPVITTDHSGLAGLITQGREGFIVPIRHPTALAAHLKTLAADRAGLAAMRESARQWSQRHSWEAYRTQLRQAVADTVRG